MKFKKIVNNMALPQFFPVIHLLNDAQGMREAEKALEANADGVFFINHHGDDAMAIRVAAATKQLHPNWYVGINLLSSGPVRAFEAAIEAGLDAIWADSVGVTSEGLGGQAHELRKLRTVHPMVDIFAGVAFKYQPEDTNPKGTVYQLSDLGWIPCTSGAATGSAAAVEKVEELSNASSTGLGLASGVSLENVASYLGLVSHFFVASSISVDDYTLDFERMCVMAGRIHGKR